MGNWFYGSCKNPQSNRTISIGDTLVKALKDYTKEQVDAMLEKLTEEERVLITSRCGEDLSNPTAGKLTKEQTDKFYGSLVPKMRRLLSNPNKERKPRKKGTRTPKKELKQPVMEKVSEVSTSTVEEPEISSATLSKSFHK